jgi:hypothetical protein
MPGPSIPPLLVHLGGRPFSFYPAILNTEHNQWIYESATWSEVSVRNCKTNQSIAIPRQYLGEISSVDAPVVIVGLLQELECHAGAVLPVERRVIEMPLAANGAPPIWKEQRSGARAPVVGIRVEDPRGSRAGRLILAGVALGVAGCVLAINLYRGGVNASRAFYAPASRADLGLRPGDDVRAVTRIFGNPPGDTWQSAGPQRGFRILSYPSRGLRVVLLGASPSAAVYLGVLDRNWRPVEAIRMPDGSSSYALLESIRKF